MKQIYKDPYNWYLGFLTVLVVLPVAAPLLMYVGAEGIAKYIYFIYSFMCHQFDNRSLHLYDYQYAWCARDTAIWTSVWLVALYVRFSNIKPLKIYWLLPFIIPIALDGGIQTIYTMLDVNPVGINDGTPLYISNNFIRFMTGAIFGIGLSLWVSPTIKEIATYVPSLKLSLRKYQIVGLSLVLMLIVYVSAVGLWSATSTSYKPKGTLDAVVRTPSRDFFARRAHGVCPTNGVIESNYKNPVDNLLDLDCFF